MSHAQVHTAQYLCRPPTFIMHGAEKGTGLEVNTNVECLSNPEVADRFSNIVPGSADWHVACKRLLIKRKLIRLIDLDICVLQCN